MRKIADELGGPYSAVRSAIIRHEITAPKRNGYIYSEEARRRKSESQKAAYRKRYPEGRFGANHPGWKGGRKMHSGYVMVYSSEHPRANPYVFEHILVAEDKLGRCLMPGEVVHHINHVRDDNRPENLQVIMRGQHVANHFAEPIELRKRIAYLERLLDEHGIDR